LYLLSHFLLSHYPPYLPSHYFSQKPPLTYLPFTFSPFSYRVTIRVEVLSNLPTSQVAHLSIFMVGRYHTPGSRAFDCRQGHWTLTHFSHGSFRQQSSIQAIANPVVNDSDQSCNMTPFTLIDAQNYESRICASVDENDIGTEAFQIMILC
jgi:hypothetical protein